MTDQSTEAGLRCPKCGRTVLGVAETRKHVDGIKRVRVCECGARFVTIEKFEKLTKKCNAITTRSDTEKPGY